MKDRTKESQMCTSMRQRSLIIVKKAVLGMTQHVGIENSSNIQPLKQFPFHHLLPSLLANGAAQE